MPDNQTSFGNGFDWMLLDRVDGVWWGFAVQHIGDPLTRSCWS